MGFSFRRGLAALGGYAAKVAENRDQLRAARELVSARNGGAKSSQFKFMHDLFGPPAAGGYTPEQMQQGQAALKGFSYAPQEGGDPAFMTDLQTQMGNYMRQKLGGVMADGSPQSPFPLPPGTVMQGKTYKLNYGGQ
jgi:hypothetical protein